VNYGFVNDGDIITAAEFSDVVETYGQPFAGSFGKPSLGKYTHMVDALNYGAGRFDDSFSPFESNVRIIDIVGDGPENEDRSPSNDATWTSNAAPVSSAVQNAIPSGDMSVINALAINGDGFFNDYNPPSISNMTAYFQSYVCDVPINSAAGAFVQTANNLADFDTALLAKLFSEVGPPPPGIPAPPAAVCLVAMAGLRCKRSVGV